MLINAKALLRFLVMSVLSVKILIAVASTLMVLNCRILTRLKLVMWGEEKLLTLQDLVFSVIK